MRTLIHRLWEQFQELTRQVGELEREIKPFANGRQLAAGIGLVP